jgi:molecular chaperone DnaK (HSP70)
MGATKTAAGLDWGSAKFSAALWDSPHQTRMVSLADGQPFAPAAVRFETADHQLGLSTHFPLAEGDLHVPDTLTFLEIKNKLPAYAHAGVQQFVAEAILAHYRPLFGSGSVHLGLSVPFEYSADMRGVLRAAAAEAGFEGCDPVLEPLAAALAHTPDWLNQPAARASLQRGVCLWIVDCGALDLTITVVHVRLDGKMLNVAYLAAECIPGLGGTSLPVHASKLELIPAAVKHLRDEGFSTPWPNWHGTQPNHGEPAIIVPCGGGDTLEASVTAIAALLPPGTVVAQGVTPAEAVARGCAVHAAMYAGAFDHRVNARRRLILGLRTRGKDGEQFSPLTMLKDEPPLTFDRAFSIDAAEDALVDISLAAAMPGGGRLAGVWSLSLTPERLKEMRHHVILVSGRLDDWRDGHVEVRDAGTSSVLGQGSFQLPN